MCGRSRPPRGDDDDSETRAELSFLSLSMTKESSSSARRSSCGPSISGARRSRRTSDVHTAPWSSKPSEVRDDATIAPRSENQDDASALDDGAMRDAVVMDNDFHERVYERGRRATSIAISSGHRHSSLLPLHKVDAARDESLCRQERDVPPTALEALLDSELFDTHASASSTHEDNQFALQQEQQQADDDFGELGSLSLELLAMQSPHGKHPQWESDDIGGTAAGERAELQTPELVSPHFAPMPLSSSSLCTPQLRYDFDFDLADNHSGDVDAVLDGRASPPPAPAPPRSAAKREHRHSFVRTPRDSGSVARASSIAAQPHTPAFQPTAPQHPTPPAASVTKRKVKHGGIYSLLLKNRVPGDHEPVLVADEKRSPEVPEDSPGRLARSSGKRSPPGPLSALHQSSSNGNGGPHHGSIYRMLRQSRSGAQC